MARKTTAAESHYQPVKMGLGEAVQRLIQVEWTFRTGAGGSQRQQLLDEREMLLRALDVIPVDVGFDCNADGIPDTVDIFQAAASTSCCRLMPPGTKPKAKKRGATTSRRKKKD